MEDNNHLTLAAIYCPPRFKIWEDQFLTFFIQDRSEDLTGPCAILFGDS